MKVSMSFAIERVPSSPNLHFLGERRKSALYTTPRPGAAPSGPRRLLPCAHREQPRQARREGGGTRARPQKGSVEPACHGAGAEGTSPGC